MRKLKTGDSREEQIEAFASGGDPALGSTQKTAKPLSTPAGADKDSPQAAHNFCSINLGLNRYEKNLLDQLSKQTGRSRLNVLRAALIEYGKRHS